MSVWVLVDQRGIIVGASLNDGTKESRDWLNPIQPGYRRELVDGPVRLSSHISAPMVFPPAQSSAQPPSESAVDPSATDPGTLTPRETELLSELSRLRQERTALLSLRNECWNEAKDDEYADSTRCLYQQLADRLHAILAVSTNSPSRQNPGYVSDEGDETEDDFLPRCGCYREGELLCCDHSEGVDCACSCHARGYPCEAELAGLPDPPEGGT